MVWLARWFFWCLAKCVFSLRYRVHVEGREHLRGAKSPVLLLPNHPALIDPPLMIVTFWPRLRPRPLLYEAYFRNPIMHMFMRLLHAIPVPDLNQPSQQARVQTEKAIADLVAALRGGDNALLWPSGHIQRAGREVLGSARALTEILKTVPEAHVVLARTRGVWGSMFSYAQTGQAPRLGRNLRVGIGWLFANLLFFMPRRHVHITLEKLDRAKLPEMRRERINPWFEAWYNADGSPEKPTYVPYHFLFGPRTFDFPRLGGLAEVDLTEIKRETQTAVAQLLGDKLGRELTPDEQKPHVALDQLGLDSLERMELSLEVEHRFGFAAGQVPTDLGQLWALAQGLADKEPPKPPPPEWFHLLPNTDAVEIIGDTIAEAFVNRALAHRRDVAAADDIAGVVTYERLLIGALLMSKRFARLPGANVGLMLPASVGCSMAFLALHLAGKLPVLLNWTTGPANLAHAAKLMNLTHVVTSRRFLDRLHITVDGVENFFLEDLRQGIGKFEMLRTLLKVRLFPGSVRRHVPRVPVDQPAVVLFTSGSEKAPKAVPLTHRNLLTNERSCISFLSLSRQDSLLAFLPPFHSFGLSVTGLLPLLCGIRVVHHPDPTDAAGLARKIAAYQPTIVVGTPTFISYIVERAEPGALASLRLIIVGAEKCPPALVERCAQAAPGAFVLEGYGITECSPVVSGNRPGAIRAGTVGTPLSGVELCVVDLETDRELPRNEMGMLLVAGPTVFPGYIGEDSAPPFRERDGKRWYVTGDLAKIDDDGFIHLCGRLKRFLKAGGEMISLPALEEPFGKRYPPTEAGPRVAVEGIEIDHGRRIVLFTTEPISLRDANAILWDEGFRGVMRLDDVRRLDALPVLGTGKTDYKVLRERIHEERKQTVS
jgi:long-chain-fatty-acid--[acyl-carrier-protein] ligase